MWDFNSPVQFSSVQLLSRIWLFATPWIAAHQASLSITNSQSSLRLASIESVMPSSHLILCCPFLLLPSIFPSIRVFSNESVLHIRWPKYWSFSFSISPSSEYSGLISFRIDWLDLLHPIFRCIISFDKMYTFIGSITRNQKPPAAATTEHKTCHSQHQISACKEQWLSQEMYWQILL